MVLACCIWPEHFQADMKAVTSIADRVLAAHVRGQLFLGIIVGVVTMIGLSLIGVSQQAALAIISGIFELIPILGPWRSIVVAPVVVLATNPDRLIAVEILFVAVQQLENTLLAPRIQVRAVNMNPALIIVPLVVGGFAFGMIRAITMVRRRPSSVTAGYTFTAA